MAIGFLRIDVLLSGTNSLKDKRQIIRSLEDRLRKRFNISVAEIEGADLWQRAVLGISCVAKEKRLANKVLSKVVDYIEGSGKVELIDYRVELL